MKNLESNQRKRHSAHRGFSIQIITDSFQNTRDQMEVEKRFKSTKRNEW